MYFTRCFLNFAEETRLVEEGRGEEGKGGGACGSMRELREIVLGVPSSSDPTSEQRPERMPVVNNFAHRREETPRANSTAYSPFHSVFHLSSFSFALNSPSLYFSLD